MTWNIPSSSMNGLQTVTFSVKRYCLFTLAIVWSFYSFFRCSFHSCQYHRATSPAGISTVNLIPARFTWNLPWKKHFKTLSSRHSSPQLITRRCPKAPQSCQICQTTWQPKCVTQTLNKFPQTFLLLEEFPMFFHHKHHPHQKGERAGGGSKIMLHTIWFIFDALPPSGFHHRG